MALRESEAIILQCYPLGEADRLVSFLSRSQGRLRGVAAGARRPRSRFGSTLERFSHVRIWFYERETRELVRLNQCELIESFVNVFGNYSAGVVLALFSEVAEATLPEREPADASFRLLLMSAQAVKRSGNPEPALTYFVLWTARLGGWLAPLDRCTRCGRDIAGELAWSSVNHPGFYCGSCRSPGLRKISEGALGAARRMLRERLDSLSAENFREGELRELRKYMLDLLENQIERKLTTRRILEEKD